MLIIFSQIKFEDESYAEFRYPLLINAPKFNEVGVLTIGIETKEDITKRLNRPMWMVESFFR